MSSWSFTKVIYIYFNIKNFIYYSSNAYKIWNKRNCNNSDLGVPKPL